MLHNQPMGQHSSMGRMLDEAIMTWSFVSSCEIFFIHSLMWLLRAGIWLVQR